MCTQESVGPMPLPDPCATTRNLRNLRLGNGTLGSLKQDQSKMTHLVRNVNYTLCSGWRCTPSAEVLHRYLDHARLGVGAYFRVITGGACLVMSPQVRVLRAALWRSLSSEGVPLRCGLQTWGLLCEVCVVLCSGRGRDTVSLVTRGNSVFVAANRVLKRGRSENDVVFRKTLCCEARPHLPDKKDKAGRKG